MSGGHTQASEEKPEDLDPTKKGGRDMEDIIRLILARILISYFGVILVDKPLGHRARLTDKIHLSPFGCT